MRYRAETCRRTVGISWVLVVALWSLGSPVGAAADEVFDEHRVDTSLRTSGLSQTRSFLSQLLFAAPGLLVAREGGISPFGLTPAGLPVRAPDVELGPGADPSAVIEIPAQGVRAFDLLVADRANGRLVRLHHDSIAGWQTIATFGTGAGPAAMTHAWDPERTTVTDETWVAVAAADADELALFQRDDDGGIQPAGTVATGDRPVAVTATAYLDDFGESLLVANMASDSVSLHSGAGYGQRVDVAVGKAPVGFAELDDDVFAVANRDSASLSVVAARDGRFRLIRTIDLPGTRPVAIASGSIDRDDHLDLLVADAAGPAVRLLHGTAGGGLRAGVTIPLSDEPVGIVTDALGGDHVGDFAVAGRSGSLSTFVARGDQLLSESYAAGMAARGGRIVWSHYIGQTADRNPRWGLSEWRGSEPVALPTGTSTEPIKAQLGIGPRGHPTATYLRCAERCRPYRYDFARGAETALRRLRAPSGCALLGVGSWRTRVAYAIDRSYDDACPRRMAGVWLGRGSRFRRISSGRYPRLGEMTGKFLGWSEWYGRHLTNVRVRIRRRGRAPMTAFRVDASYYDVGFEITGPFVDRGDLYWGSFALNSVGPHVDATLYRQRGVARRRCRRSVEHGDGAGIGIPGNWNETRLSFAIDAGKIYYVANDLPFSANMERLGPALACPSR